MRGDHQIGAVDDQVPDRRDGQVRVEPLPRDAIIERDQNAAFGAAVQQPPFRGVFADDAGELIVGDAKYLLNAGDSICYRSEQPHGYKNGGDKPAKVIIVNTPPSF